MRKYITLFFSVSLFFISCKKNKAPDGIVKHDRMVNLLTDFHWVEGRMYGIFKSQDSLYKYGTSRYDALFKRYGTDSAGFKKSLKYYTTQPAELQKMYDQVLLNLKQKGDSLTKVQRKTDSLKRL